MDGIIPLYKPKGLTSHDCVARIRRLLKIKKVGHTGTLDPGVEGVLPICVGEATKIIPFVLDLQKEYVAEISLGKSTTTEDAEGEIVAAQELKGIPAITDIKLVLSEYKGTLEQIPPMYSAVKINGKKLYEYAREGIEVERPTRIVTIHQIELLLESSNIAKGKFRIRVLCSKGTYIRTLCVTIGKELGYPAHMSDLLRTKSDGIMLENTLTFSDIEAKLKSEQWKDIFLPVAFGLNHLPAVQVDAIIKQKILQGQKLPLPGNLPENRQFKMMHQNELLAIYERYTKGDNIIKPVRVFNMFKSVGE